MPSALGEPLGDASSRGDAYVRQLRASIIGLAVVIAAVVLLISALPGLDDIERELSHTSATWLLIAIAFEYLSCVGYVLTILLGIPQRSHPPDRTARVV